MLQLNSSGIIRNEYTLDSTEVIEFGEKRSNHKRRHALTHILKC